jgi:hypothetical protein
MTDRMQQLAQQVIEVIDSKTETPEARLRIIKAYMLGLVDGITAKDAELDTCTKCGKKTGEPSYVLGHTGLYCPECSAELCRKSEGPSEQPVVKRLKVREFPNPGEAPKCSICCNEGELTSILTHEGRIFKVCDRCRKALEDPKVQEALHKG